jgi:hypothetical protein
MGAIVKIVTYVASVTLAASLATVQGVRQSATRLDAPGKENMFATNEFFAKGGIGIIRENLYIALNSPKNELVLNAGNRWVGMDASKAEVVIFFDSRIWSPQSLPDRFDLSDAVVVSFESSKVRFFDFRSMSGGYYKRPREK